MSDSRSSFSDPGSNTPTEMRPCDLFSEEIHLLVDGELGPAETTVVEEHIQVCPRCLALTVRLEQMSSMLKAWDTDTNAMPAPALRIKHSVLARVAEHSQRRRRESHLVGLMQYATAALALLALGAGLWIGLGARAAAVEEPALSSSLASRGEAWPLDRELEKGFSFPARVTSDALAAVRILADVPADVDTFATLGSLAGEPDWNRAGAWKTVWADAGGRNALRFIEERLQKLDVFAQRVGARSTYWPGPRVDEPGQRRITLGALSWLHRKGKLTEWKLATPDASHTASRTVVADTQEAGPNRSVATDMTAFDMLAPMPGVGRELKSLFTKGRKGRLDALPAFAVGNLLDRARKGAARSAAARKVRIKSGPELLEAWPLPLVDPAALSSGPIGAGPRSFMDPVKAEGNLKLKLREEHDGKGSLIAIVEGTTEPIFLPAGQFIQGGIGARVVAEPVWLPAAMGKKHYNVRCRIVQNNAGRETVGFPTLAPFVAGPTIRALLAANAPVAEVTAAAARIVALWQRPGYDMFRPWSLLDLFGGKAGKANFEKFQSRVDWERGRGGFVVRDGRGALVGIESVRFEGAAAEELIMRLWMGYYTEAWLRHMRVDEEVDPALRRAPAVVHRALAPSGDELSQALRHIASHHSFFRVSRGLDPTQGWRVSSLEIVAAGLHLHALEVAQRPMVVSVLSGLQPAR